MKDAYYIDGKAIAYTMHGNSKGWVLLTHVWVRPDERGKGLGTTMLLRVLADADAEHKIVALDIQPDPDALDADELAAWYQRHGFVFLNDWSLNMIRKPKEESTDGD